MHENDKKKMKNKRKYLRDGDPSAAFLSTNIEYRVNFTVRIFEETYPTFL